MESRSPNVSDGGGGREGSRPARPSTPPPASSPRSELRGDGGPRPPSPPRGRDVPPVPVLRAFRPSPSSSSAALSLDQIRVARCSNEYTEGPTVAQNLPGDEEAVASPPAPRADEPQRRPESREQGPLNNLRNLLPPIQGASSVTEDSPVSDEGSVSSLQMLMGCPGAGSEAIRAQPKRAEADPEELKALNGGAGGPRGRHSDRCADCGRCRCPECARPLLLPSLLLCGRRCVCSAQSAAEYGTCVCCVKGLFYHCSSDDEDTCADKPFSCTQPHRCARWTAVSLLSVPLPCIVCYLPAKACVAACQCCYDRVARPGCRCESAGRRRPVRSEAVEQPT